MRDLSAKESIIVAGGEGLVNLQMPDQYRVFYMKNLGETLDSIYQRSFERCLTEYSHDMFSDKPSKLGKLEACVRYQVDARIDVFRSQCLW